jgi:hypothetical protein
MDQKYFVAINYVGIQGIKLDRIDFGKSNIKYLETNNYFEEMK